MIIRALSVFTATKRKPSHVVPNAHQTLSFQPSTSKRCFGTDLPSQDMIVSLVACPSSDFVVSGGHDGFLRTWKMAEAGAAVLRGSDNKQGEKDESDSDESDSDDELPSPKDVQDVESNTFNPPNPKRGGLMFNSEMNIAGYINSIAIVTENQCNLLIVASGREHRSGRWRVLKNVKDGITVMCF
jgi:hypothetical protein